ncbi:hypothetical protein BX600DRAFT_520014 [Xylariales sp. PMI_506]|nr:hypothetical protein BX600DRAFT_520014 [Xylariales sp. PMI_506]
MHFTKTLFSTMVVAMSMCVGHAQLLSPEDYQSYFAAEVLARLDEYESSHTLTDPQAGFISQVTALLKSPEITQDLVTSLNKSCREVFDVDECTYLETGHRPGEKLIKRGLLEERASCTCSTSSDYCIVQGCSACDAFYTTCTQKSGCGEYWLFTCNGRCYGC